MVAYELRFGSPTARHLSWLGGSSQPKAAAPYSTNFLLSTS